MAGQEESAVDGGFFLTTDYTEYTDGEEEGDEDGGRLVASKAMVLQSAVLQRDVEAAPACRQAADGDGSAV